MKSILANHSRMQKVKKINEGIREKYRGLTLEDVLILGYDWNRDKIDIVMSDNFQHKDLKGNLIYSELKEFMYTWDYNSTDRSLNRFKCFNQPAITRHARFRATFLQDMKSKGYNLNQKYMSMQQLEEISCHSIGYATVTYAIKCFLLANYTDDGIKAFKGIQAQTGPVYNTLQHLFGHKFSNYQQTTLCNDLALDTGISATDINTAFYTMG